MKNLIIIAVLAILVPFWGSAEDVEKIDVIGSHIKRINMEGAAPILTIDREQIETSGYDGLGDILTDLPEASFGGGTESSINSDSSFSTTSLRGIGSGKILILLDGNRVSPAGGSSTVNLNIFPMSMIERIEILKNGASAIYGSDAVGGVINIVTKKDFTGGQVNVQGSLTQRVEGNSLDSFTSFLDFQNWNDVGPSSLNNFFAGKGDKITIDASYGGSKNDINYIVGGQVRFQSPLYLRDRSFGKLKPEHYSIAGSPGTWAGSNDVLVPDPKCPAENITDGKCGFNFSPYMQFRPQILQGSTFGRMQTEKDGINWEASAFYTYTRTHSIIAPPPDSFSDEREVGKSDSRVPVETAKRWEVPTTEPITLYYRLVEEEGLGPRNSINNKHAYQARVGMNRAFGNALLDADLIVSGTNTVSTGVSGYAVKSKLLKKANADPSQFNPFLSSGKKSDLSDATYEPVTERHANLVTFEPTLSGELMDKEDFSLSFAVGDLLGWQRYSEANDDITERGDQWGGGVANSGEGMRAFNGIYGELSLLSLDMLEVQLAARTDMYYYLEGDDSRFELTAQKVPFTDIEIPFSPQIAFSLQPIEEVKFRASLGTSFKAPDLSSIYHGETITHPSSIDWKTCPKEEFDKKKTECIPKQHKVLISGNTKLKSEISTNLNLGMVIEPLKGLSASLDYFQISQENLVGSPSGLLGEIFKYEHKKGAQALKDNFNIHVNRDSTGKVETVVAGPANLSNSHIKGVDLELNLSTPLEMGWDFDLDFKHSHLLYAEGQAFQGGDLIVSVPYYEWLQDLLDLENENRGNTATYPGIPRWRNTSTFKFSNKDMGHSFAAVVHNIPGQLKTEGNEKDETDYYWRLDLVGTFTLNKKTSLIVGIQDVLAASLPKNDVGFISPGGYTNAALYDLRGRMLNARLTYNFK